MKFIFSLLMMIASSSAFAMGSKPQQPLPTLDLETVGGKYEYVATGDAKKDDWCSHLYSDLGGSHPGFELTSGRDANGHLFVNVDAFETRIRISNIDQGPQTTSSNSISRQHYNEQNAWLELESRKLSHTDYDEDTTWLTFIPVTTKSYYETVIRFEADGVAICRIYDSVRPNPGKKLCGDRESQYCSFRKSS